MTATMTLSPRVRPLDGVRQSLSLSWRTLVSIKHSPMELIDFSVQPIMFLLLFTYVFGGAIAGSTDDYLTFALPGIIVQNSLFATLNTGMGLTTDLTKGVFDRLRALPIARWAPLTGRIVADLVKQAWAVALLLGLGTLMGFRFGTDVVSVLGAVLLLLTFSLAMSWTAVLVGVLVDAPEKVMMFGMAVMFPLTFIGNVFVPSGTMPDWMRKVAEINPVTHVADACRGLLVGGPVAGPVTTTLLWAAAILVVFAPLAVRAYRRRV
jgi:oleandomycin transport system permease protein